MNMSPLISVIIPFKNSLDTLPRLLDSIPDDEDIEIILVENSDIPLDRNELNLGASIKLLNCPSNRYAGGARNIGLDNCHGEWVVFADADDFFSKNAFEVFKDTIARSQAELIYFKVESVFDDTLKPSNRGDMWNSLIDSYLKAEIDETDARLNYVVPWGKLIKKDLIDRHKIRFEEVLASNDTMFSTKCGYFARSFEAIPKSVYVVTTRKGSLANRRDINALKSRYQVTIRRNEFLCSHNLSDRQGSIMRFLFESIKFGPLKFFQFLGTAIKHRQNPFIGYRNWYLTFKFIKKDDKEKSKYLQF